MHKDPYRTMDTNPEVKLSLYERLMRFAEENGVKRHLLTACGAVLCAYAFIKVPYWFGVFMGTMMTGEKYWSPPISSNGEPDQFAFAMISWITGAFLLAVLWGGYAFSATIFKSKSR